MKITTFQLIVLAVFVVLTVVGVVIFASQGGLGGKNSTGKVTIWGTLDQNTMDRTLAAMRAQDKSFSDVVYKHQDPATYTSDLINAMASGNGPDLFLIPQDQIIVFADKLAVIPYSAVSQQTFINSYIDEGRLFLTTNGSLALPFVVDPIVMYWNRDLLNGAGIAQPPQYWSDFLDMAPRLTILSANGDVTKSAVALGEWSNVRYAKDILSALFIQAGDPIVTRDQTGAAQSVFGTTPQQAQENPAASALQYYTEFANPSKNIYSWNRALPDSQDAFVAGDVGVYFGLASDYPSIVARNPNLHFAVAPFPQLQGSTVKSTYGAMLGLAIPRVAANPTGALVIAEGLSSQAGITALSANTILPPVRRDVVVDTSANAAASVFVQSALIARGWLDPDPSKTDDLFASMIQSVVSGKNQPSGAVAEAAQALQVLVPLSQ